MPAMAPFIWIPKEKCNIREHNGKYICNDKFSVEAIEIKDKVITGIAIKNGENRVFACKKTV